MAVSKGVKFAHVSLVITCCVIGFSIMPNFTCALYEDQAGKFDWKQQYIGKVNHIQLLRGGSRIIVGTVQNVLASLTPRTGSLVWRQIQERGEVGNIDSLSGTGDTIVSLTGAGTTIRVWDANTGFLKTETIVNSKIDSIPEPGTRSYYQLVPDLDQLIIISSVPTEFDIHISSFNLTNGDLLWTFKVPTTWTANTSCQFMGQLLFMCLDHTSQSLHTMSVNQAARFKETPLSALDIHASATSMKLVLLQGAVSRQPLLFALQLSPNHHKLLSIGPEGIAAVQDLPDVIALDVFEIAGSTILFTLSSNEDNTEILAVDLDSGEVVVDASGKLQLPSHHGEILKMCAYGIARKDGVILYRLLFVLEDHSFILLHSHGKMVWTREEALASVVSAEMVDLPLSESDAKFEQEFREGESNILSMCLKRLTSQLLHLENYLVVLLNGLHGQNKTSAYRSSFQLTRDEFNLNKLIIVVTSPGKVFGLDGLTGQIVWSYLIPNIAPYNRNGVEQLLLFVQRTTYHYPHPPQCVILGKNKNSGDGMLFVFNPITGQLQDKGIIHLGFEVAQAMMLPQSDVRYLRALILLDVNNNVHAYPSTAIDIAKTLSGSLFMFVADVKSGLLNGYSLEVSDTKHLTTVPVWQISLSKSTQTISQVVCRSNEHVHSQGRVMGDRNVMYKYLNPNLAAVVTEGEDSQKKPFFNILLVDMVTGNVVFSAIHRRSRGPIHVIHSENWVVYTYNNEKARRIEVSVLELYEGILQSNTTAFSSLSPPQLPMVERQAYIFPQAIETAAVTITEKGITSKHLLFALSSGGILELPKMFLDPRRPLVASQEHKEEGVYPYIPELPIPSESIINYNQSVLNVRGIHTAPAGLESTCLVLIYGLDIFYTRVTPSRTFDVLKDDFDHYLISAVLLGLILASYFTRRLAARKALQQAWK